MPKVKKKISSFLLGEEGQISKKALVGMGAVLAAAGVQSAKAWRCVHSVHSEHDNGC